MSLDCREMNVNFYAMRLILDFFFFVDTLYTERTLLHLRQIIHF